jgi:endonuclease/exonuclease/phosphatase family metal-dependent hydrolase
VPRAACSFVAALLAVVLTGCAHSRPDLASRPQTCRDVLPDPASPVAWIAPADARDRERLADWCAAVGPILYRPSPAAETTVAVDRLAIVTWNVHVGGGDIDQLIRRLTQGAYTGGEPVVHFVLLLQEAHRREGGVPAPVARGLPAPARIESHRPGERGDDVERIARRHGLALLYAPSMRNGADENDAEDRGNAILSTLRLGAPAVVELPFEHQRRAAAVATVDGHTRVGQPWLLRVADVHLDTALALTRGGPFAARGRQAAALVNALADDEDIVLGGDFNTWLGSREPAMKVLRAAFPAHIADPGTTWKGPLGFHANLDRLFVRGHVTLERVARLPDRLGSDHYPVLGMVHF